jgi:CHAD domain-containing protein
MIQPEISPLPDSTWVPPEGATPASSPAVAPQHANPPVARPARERVSKLALKQLDKFMALEPKVLRGRDPDAIHDMRVASRRLQQMLGLLWHDNEGKESRRLMRTLRRSRRAMGEVRNFDVLLARAQKELARKRARHHGAWEAAKEYLEVKREQAFRDMLRALSKLNLTVLYVGVKDALSPAPPAESPVIPFPDSPAADHFHVRLAKQLAGHWDEFEEKAGESQKPGGNHGLALHAARIAVKRLRYEVEVTKQLDVPGSDDVLRWLRSLQERLGNWHDLEVLEEVLVEMVARKRFLRQNLETSMEVQKLILRVRAEKQGLVAKYQALTQDAATWAERKDWVREFAESSLAVSAAI